MGYLICENCKEEFELEPEENKDHFDDECDECGGKLKYIEENLSDTKKICSECGDKNSDNAKFCKNCGYVFLKKSKNPKYNSGICPYCAEKINPSAVKCKHCGEWLNKEKHPKKPSEDYSGVIILGIIFTIFGGVIGFIISIYLVTREDKKARDTGLVLLIINIVWILILWLIISSLMYRPYYYY